MLRVAARIRHELGRGALDPVVTAYGESYFDKPRGSGMRDRLSTPDHLVEVLTTAGIDLDFASAADETTGRNDRRRRRDRPVSHGPRRWYANHFVWRGRSFILRAGDLEFHGAQMR